MSKQMQFADWHIEQRLDSANDTGNRSLRAFLTEIPSQATFVPVPEREEEAAKCSAA